MGNMLLYCVRCTPPLFYNALIFGDAARGMCMDTAAQPIPEGAIKGMTMPMQIMMFLLSAVSLFGLLAWRHGLPMRGWPRQATYKATMQQHPSYGSLHSSNPSLEEQQPLKTGC